MNNYYNRIEKVLDDKGDIAYLLRTRNRTDEDIDLADGFLSERHINKILEVHSVLSVKDIFEFCKENNLHGLEMKEGDLFYENYKTLHEKYELNEEWLLVGGERDVVINPALSSKWFSETVKQFEELQQHEQDWGSHYNTSRRVEDVEIELNLNGKEFTPEMLEEKAKEIHWFDLDGFKIDTIDENTVKVSLDCILYGEYNYWSECPNYEVASGYYENYKELEFGFVTDGPEDLLKTELFDNVLKPLFEEQMGFEISGIYEDKMKIFEESNKEYYDYERD